jgi:hypothetical protein
VHPKVAQIVLSKDKEDKEDKGEWGMGNGRIRLSFFVVSLKKPNNPIPTNSI